MRCTLLPLDNMKEATAYLPLGDQSLLRGWLLRRSPLCLSSRVGPGVLCVAVVALRVRGAKGFCGRERFWAGEKQRRRKRGTLIRFVVRRRLGEEGFCAEEKARRKETKRLSCTYLRVSFLCWPGWPFLVEGVSATEKDERDKKNKSRARHEQQRR